MAPAPPLVTEGPVSLQGEASHKPAPTGARVAVNDPAPNPDAAQATTQGEIAVSLRWADDDTPVVGHEVIVTDRWVGTTPRRLAGGHTGPDGSATLSLAPGDYLVMVLVHTGQRVRVVAGRRTGVSLRLPRAGIVTGRVVDESDSPIADAEILATRGDLAGRTSRLATSGADGTFRASLTNSMSFLFARKRGHGASAAVQVRTIANAEAQVDLIVAAATTAVRGRVVDESHRPIEGARVVLGAPVPPPRGNLYVEPGVRPETSSAADGTFAFDDVPPGDGGCTAVAPGWRTGNGALQARLGITAEVLIVLTPGTRVVGRVVDAQGQPAAGAVVATSRYPSARDKVTAADGRFACDVPPGRVELVARHRTGGVALLAVDVADRETLDVELRLRSDPVLFGRVVDEQGAPLAGLWVFAWPQDERAWQPNPCEVTDQDGRFAMLTCTNGPLDVKVRQDRLDSGPVLARADAVLAGGTPLALVVADAARPTAFVRLRVDDPAHPTRPCQIVVQDLASGAEEWFVVAKARPARLGPLAAGSYRVRQFHAFDRTKPVLGLDLGPIALAVGQERNLGTHVLLPTTSLALTLARSDGERVNVPPRLRLVPADGSPAIAAHFTPDGDVYPFSFPPGRYRVEVEAALEHDAASAEVDLVADATTPLTLTLPALRPCQIRMRPPEGRHPPYRARATLRRADEPPREVEAWNGLLRLGLQPGAYTLTVDVEGWHGSTQFTVDGVSGGELRVDLPVQGG